MVGSVTSLLGEITGATNLWLHITRSERTSFTGFSFTAYLLMFSCFSCCSFKLDQSVTGKKRNIFRSCSLCLSVCYCCYPRNLFSVWILSKKKKRTSTWFCIALLIFKTINDWHLHPRLTVRNALPKPMNVEALKWHFKALLKCQASCKSIWINLNTKNIKKKKNVSSYKLNLA